MINWLQANLVPYAQTLPLELFVFFASFFEEIIPPIPAFPIMILAGGFARVQDYYLLQILLLALASALGKTVGSVLVYHLADKLEDAFVIRFGKFFGLKPGQPEAFGAKLGNGWLDYLVLTLLRSFPLIPSSLISIGSGILSIPLRLFLFATFLGTVLRDGIYIYAGYMGTIALASYTENTERSQLIVVASVIIILVLSIAFFYHKNQKRKQGL